MGELLALERFQWFDQQLRKKRYPNARTLARRFEVSTKTAQRTIHFMQERLNAPLEYDPSRKGYYYEDETFHLPFLQATQEELLAILVARNLLSDSAGGIISRAIGRFGRKLFTATSRLGLSEARIGEAFSAVWPGHSPAQGEVFNAVADALIRARCLRFTYTAPSTGETTRRTVEPHHLQHYLGNWVLLAWCRSRDDWRKFLLSRMSGPAAHGTFTPRPRTEWTAQLEGGFGIFQGDELTGVVLRFTPGRARWIREQMWHPEQRIQELADGSLELSFPVADFREVKLKILQFGADVEVLEPAGLREEIRREIGKMAEVYGSE